MTVIQKLFRIISLVLCHFRMVSNPAQYSSPSTVVLLKLHCFHNMTGGCDKSFHRCCSGLTCSSTCHFAWNAHVQYVCRGLSNSMDVHVGLNQAISCCYFSKDPENYSKDITYRPNESIDTSFYIYKGKSGEKKTLPLVIPLLTTKCSQFTFQLFSSMVETWLTFELIFQQCLFLVQVWSILLLK